MKGGILAFAALSSPKRSGPVAQHHDDLGVELSGGGPVNHSLKIGPAAGYEHCKPQLSSGFVVISSCCNSLRTLSLFEVLNGVAKKPNPLPFFGNRFPLAPVSLF